MDIRSGNIAVEMLENGNIRIGKFSHEVFAFQEYSRDEIINLKSILEEIIMSDVLDHKKLEREERYQ